MKNKKTIAHKNKRIRKFVYGLREIIVREAMKQWSLLREDKKGKSRLEKIAIEDIRSVLYNALDDSICICSGCNQIKRKMVYNALLKSWFCTLCSQEYRDFYVKEFGKDEEGLFYESFL